MHPDMIGAVLLALAVVLLGLIAFVFTENYRR
jgi:hypothetical protein